MASSGFDRPPTIEAERLRLRAHTVAAFQGSIPICNDTIVTRFIGGRPYTPEEVGQRLQRYAGSWVLLGHGFWAIEEKATGRLVGEVGIMDAKRDMDPPFGDDLEVGWALRPKVHDRGYATEALKAMLDWEQRMLASPCLVALIDPDNAASIKLAHKFGFRERARTAYRGAPSNECEKRRDA
ncbi:MAG: GNAT family N-acetyltransferase [Hyphomonadaceae bacterium]